MQPSGSGLNILLVAPQPFFQNRGTPIAIRDLLDALSETSHQITLLCLMEGEDIKLPANVSIVRARYPAFLLNLRPGFSLKKLFVGLYILKEASELVQRKNFDLVIAIEEAAIFCSIFLGDRINLVVDMDSDIVHQMTFASRFWRFLRPLLVRIYSIPFKKSLCAVAVSRSLAVTAVRLGAKEAYVLEDCADPIPENTPESDAIRTMKNCGQKIILYLGNLEKYQGIELLLEGFAAFRSKFDQPAKLVIVGGTPGHISSYRRKALDIGILESCVFTGPKQVPELWSYLKSADCLVSPRLFGTNTPMKLYTYMASKKPIVATRIDSHTQVLSDLEAYLCEVEPEDLASKIHLALSDAKAEEKAEKALEKFLKNYSREKFRLKAQSIFRDLELVILKRRCVS